MVLQTLRKGASGFIAKAFLLLLTVSFLVWGIADVFRGPSARAVAKVGDTEISADAFRQQYLDQIQQIGRRTGRPFTPEQARAFGLDRQVLNQMVAEATLDDAAKSLGLAISDEEVARTVRANPALRRPGATEFDPAYFQQLLRANNLTEPRFLAAEKQRMLRQQIASAVGGDLVAPAILLNAAHRYESEQRAVSYLAVGPAAAGPVAAPTDAQLQAFFTTHKITFRAPEYRKITVLALTPATLAPWIQVSDADIKAAYERNAARFGTPERRTVQQIVFSKADEAQQASDKIKAGETFDQIAAARGLSPKDIDLGTVVRTDLIDPKIAEAAFSLPVDGTSAPVPGAFGSALVHVTKIEPAQQQPLEQVQDVLRKELALDRARRELLDKHDAIEDDRGSGATLAEIAQKVGLQSETIDAVDRSGRDPTGAEVRGIPGGAEVIAGSFASQPGVETEPVQLPDNGGYVWYDVNEVTPARERPFDEVREQVVARWTEDETVKAVDAKAKQLLADVQGGKTLADVAGAAGLEVKSAENLQRGRAASDFSADAIAKIFDVALHGYGLASGTVPAERILFQVTGIVVPPETTAEQQAATRIGQQIETDLLLQYLAQLRTQIGVSVNEPLLQQSIGASAN
ncbi:SurA N-terminal domain-containing protein [Xanthobacter sp. DSM 24535]|uniref:peptidylprolyl isomerase n=1 Tax=Roseixanthobacter psychrophilus TaxID=3119917 RepID=UPI0037296DAD